MSTIAAASGSPTSGALDGSSDGAVDSTWIESACTERGASCTGGTEPGAAAPRLAAKTD